MSAINSYIITKHDTSTNWDNSTYTAINGELITYTDLAQLKVGNGTNTITSLSPFYHEESATLEEIKDRATVHKAITPENLNEAGLSWWCGKKSVGDLSDDQLEAAWATLTLSEDVSGTTSIGTTFNVARKAGNIITVTLKGHPASTIDNALGNLYASDYPKKVAIMPTIFVLSDNTTTKGMTLIFSDGTYSMHFMDPTNTTTKYADKTFSPTSTSTVKIWGTVTYLSKTITSDYPNV